MRASVTSDHPAQRVEPTYAVHMWWKRYRGIILSALPMSFLLGAILGAVFISGSPVPTPASYVLQQSLVMGVTMGLPSGVAAVLGGLGALSVFKRGAQGSALRRSLLGAFGAWVAVHVGWTIALTIWFEAPGSVLLIAALPFALLPPLIAGICAGISIRFVEWRKVRS